MLAARATIELQHELLARLQQARAETDRLFDHVRPEFLYERPIPERHRIVFYVGHLEAFDWNLLRERILGRTSFHSEFDNLFAFGIDPVDGGLPTDRPSDWPVLVQVCDYVSQVRQALDDGLTAALSHKVGLEDHSANQLLNVAIEHRLMHAETLAYMLHQLPLNHLHFLDLAGDARAQRHDVAVDLSVVGVFILKNAPGKITPADQNQHSDQQQDCHLSSTLVGCGDTGRQLFEVVDSYRPFRFAVATGLRVLFQFGKSERLSCIRFG